MNNSSVGPALSFIIPSRDPAYYPGTGLIAFHVVVLIFICTSAIIGNNLVINVVLRDYRLHVPTFYFVVNLAVADILTAVVYIPFYTIAVVKQEWLFGKPFCQAHTFLISTGINASLITLSFISVDRFLDINYPLFFLKCLVLPVPVSLTVAAILMAVYHHGKILLPWSRIKYSSPLMGSVCHGHGYPMKMTSKRMRLMLAYGWLHSLFWAAGPLVGWGDYTFDPHTNTCRPNWAAIGATHKSYVVLLAIFGFVLPVLVMVFCYAKIFSVVEKHVKDIEKMSCSAASMESISNLDSVLPQPSETRRKSDLRAHKMILVIIVVFFACWLPYSIIVMKKVLLEETSGSYWSINGGLTLALLTTAVNPLIFVMRDRRFKRGFMKFFCGLRNAYDPDNAVP